MQYKFIVIDDTGFMHMHGQQFETVAQAQTFVTQHKLWATHLIYDLSTAKTVLDIEGTLRECIATEIAMAEETEKIVADVMEIHGDDYDPWTEIMEDGYGYPDDNYANADIYKWLLDDHIANGTTKWDFDTVSYNTEMGTSGYDSWTDVLEHLVHIGLMSPRTV